MNKPLAVVAGFVGKFPVAGMSLYNIHYIAGLQSLGYEVHYVECLNVPDECYNPRTNCFSNDPGFALRYLDELMPRYGIIREKMSFIDRENNCHLSGWNRLNEVLQQADFLLTLADPSWRPEFEQCQRKAFVDGDPLFTQVAFLNGENPMAVVLPHYDTLFSYGVRIGKDDCTIPAAGREWIPTRPVVSTMLWDPTPCTDHLPGTTVMNWKAWGQVKYDGKIYGHKDQEFEKYIELPNRTAETIVLALGGSPPRDDIIAHGWHLVDPIEKTGTIDAYKEFIAGSKFDFGIAKHAYVASRSGWFSDRSTCYLAAGRPVLHEDTGCGDWLPTGEGVFLFSSIEDVLKHLKCLNADYAQHARAARAIAEEHFEASKIVGQMLEDAGFR